IVTQPVLFVPTMSIMADNLLRPIHVVKSATLVSNPKSAVAICHYTADNIIGEICGEPIFFVVPEASYCPIKDTDASVICSHPDRSPSILINGYNRVVCKRMSVVLVFYVGNKSGCFVIVIKTIDCPYPVAPLPVLYQRPYVVATYGLPCFTCNGDIAELPRLFFKHINTSLFCPHPETSRRHLVHKSHIFAAE